MHDIDPLRLPDRQIIDLALEYLDDEQLLRLFRSTTERLSGLKAVYSVPGQWYRVPNTKLRVGGGIKDPACGNEDAVVDPAALAVAIVTSIAGGAADLAGASGIASTIAQTINYFVLSNNQWQKDAVCRDIVTLIPGEVDLEWAEKHCSFTYWLEDWEGRRMVSPGILDWAHFYPASAPEKPYVDIPVKPDAAHDNGSCRMTMMKAHFKNWKHDQVRLVKIDMLIDDDPASPLKCGDMSIINRSLYERQIVESLDNDTRVALIRRYGQAVIDGAA